MAVKARKTQKENGKLAQIATDPVEVAEEAGLRYVSDEQPCYTRKRKSFQYFDTAGKLIRDEVRLLRIRRLAIPPAYRQVWICPLPNGHIQATGRDDRGRKQYRYHERWRSIRDENKYDRILIFGAALPEIRRRVQADLRPPAAETGEGTGHGGAVTATWAGTVLTAIALRTQEVCIEKGGHHEHQKCHRGGGKATWQYTSDLSEMLCSPGDLGIVSQRRSN